MFHLRNGLTYILSIAQVKNNHILNSYETFRLHFAILGSNCLLYNDYCQSS